MTSTEIAVAPQEGRKFGGQHYSLADIQKMGDAVVASRLFGVNNAQQAVALMLISQAEGEHPIRAAQQYHIIQGRASMKSEAMLARFQAAGGSVRWLESTDAKAKATFTHPAGGSLTIEWDMARAKTAGLGGKDNWKTYPSAMLRARVISEGVRAVFPGCVLGIYTEDEVESISPAVVTQVPSGRGVAGLDAKVAAVVGDAKPVDYSEVPEIPEGGPTDDGLIARANELMPLAEVSWEEAAHWCAKKVTQGVVPDGFSDLTKPQLEQLVRWLELGVEAAKRRHAREEAES